MKTGLQLLSCKLRWSYHTDLQPQVGQVPYSQRQRWTELLRGQSSADLNLASKSKVSWNTAGPHTLCYSCWQAANDDMHVAYGVV